TDHRRRRPQDGAGGRRTRLAPRLGKLCTSSMERGADRAPLVGRILRAVGWAAVRWASAVWQAYLCGDRVLREWTDVGDGGRDAPGRFGVGPRKPLGTRHNAIAHQAARRRHPSDFGKPERGAALYRRPVSRAARRWA